MSRKKKPEEHVNHERWLISYADFITLLFAFFVVMYAISELDKRKMSQARQSFRFALDSPHAGGDNKDPFAVHEPASVLPWGDLDPLPQATAINSDEGGDAIKKSEGMPSDRKPSTKKVSKRERQKLAHAKAEIEASILVEGLKGSKLGIEVALTNEGLRIRIPSAALFDDDSSELRGDAWELLDDFGLAMRHLDRGVRVDGHENPDATRPKDDWEVSLLRATTVARFLIRRGGVPARNVSAAGHGGHRPVAESGSPANRRYEIIVLAEVS